MNIDLSKEVILLNEEGSKELKSFNSFKELFLFLNKENLIIKSVKDSKIETFFKNDIKNIKIFYFGILTHKESKNEFEFEVNEHRIDIKEKIEYLKLSGVDFPEEELKILNKQFSFLPDSLINS